MCSFHLRKGRNHGNPPADASSYTAGELEQQEVNCAVEKAFGRKAELLN